MVSAAWAAAAAVVDPELWVVTIEDLGILRDVAEQPSGRVIVTITPTYAGCPAMDVIRSDIRRALVGAGFSDVDVVTQLRPAWTTDMISEAGRRKLAEAGIAPPEPRSAAAPRPSGTGASPSGTVLLRLSVRCPRCGSPETEELARFGSTPCKALWRCQACAEPFERVKPI